MKLAALFVALVLPTLTVAAEPPYSGPDYSGIYDCTGMDGKEGPYTGTVTLQLNREQSSGQYGAYAFKLEVQGFGAYPGEAVAQGKMLAIHFALTDPSTGDHGTGLATIGKDKRGRLTFHKFYYEPEYKGGNHGMEDCVKR